LAEGDGALRPALTRVEGLANVRKSQGSTRAAALAAAAGPDDIELQLRQSWGWRSLGFDR